MKHIINYKAIVNEAMKNNKNAHYLNDEERAKLQNCLYNMAVDLDMRCRKYGIKLFLVGGSLLGAVRHKGFIPWDDDMDLAASREDYEKLKNIFNDEFSNDYELRCPNSQHPTECRFMKIYKKGTVLKGIGKPDPFQPQCVYVDIFPCDYVPNGFIFKRIKGISMNTLMLISSCVVEKKCGDYSEFIQNANTGKFYLRFRQFIGMIFSFFDSQKWLDILDKTVRHKKETQFVTLAFGRKHYFGEILQADVFFPLREMKFVNHDFYVLADSDSYLKNLYGDDYMIPPDESKRESHFIVELKVD